MTHTPAPARRRTALMLIALVLVALNLRLAITSAAALLTLLTESGALNSATVVLIPAIPTAVFAVAGVSTARLAARWGVERTVAVGLAVLTAGLLIRAIPSPWIVVLGTVVATGGLAVVNILLPAVVRAHFGRSIGSVTTVYSTAMSLGAATAAATAVPVAVAVGSPTVGLAAWAVPALIALAVWAVVMPIARPARAEAPAAAEIGARRVRAAYPAGTWLLASFFALQSLLSYVVMGWLPTIATDAGLSPERAGLLLGITMAVGVPATVLIMPLARGAGRMRVGFAVVGSATAAGVLGLLFAPLALPEVWAGLLGLGMCAFPLALALIATIGKDAAESARVSTAVQSIGYTVATLGPLGAGALHQATQSWTPVLVLLIVGAAAQITVGVVLTGVVWRRRPGGER
ncbi:MFS transporter [Leucobacter sp. NPDC015123]|uniref:MFS transporter n=1 Tax=Leucobacter sp. NPDC015123 TaxID=3364129 RepID=UPI0036F482CF